MMVKETDGCVRLSKYADTSVGAYDIGTRSEDTLQCIHLVISPAQVSYGCCRAGEISTGHTHP